MTTPGCTITVGPRPWQILQRDADGFATLALEGTWAPAPAPEGQEHLPQPEPVVVVRIVDEATAAPPVAELDWHPATAASDGTWHHALRVPSGGLYRLETGVQQGPIEWAHRGDVVHHIGVGELWVIAGQSNAAGYGRGPVDDPVELGVHLLRNDERWALATHPMNDATGSDHPNAEAANPGHSPFLSFGRELKRRLGCPVGLIQTARGATGMDSWNPVHSPGAPLYENLLHCTALGGGRVAGVVWYQGEGEAESTELASQYETRLTELIDSLRTDLGDPGLPIVVVQLARFDTEPASDDADRGWTIVREAQRAIRSRRDRVAVVGTLDLALSDLIHLSPAANLVLGPRMADAALDVAYGTKGRATFPDAVAARVTAQGSVVVVFDGVTQRLHWNTAPIDDFVIEDDDGRVPLEAARVIAANEVELVPARVLAGEAQVHGSYGRDPSIRMYDVGNNRPALGFFGLAVEKEQSS